MRVFPACDATWQVIEGITYLTVYTDGAAFDADYSLTARAGWAVWYSDGSTYNYYQPLAGYIQ